VSRDPAQEGGAPGPDAGAGRPGGGEAPGEAPGTASDALTEALEESRRVANLAGRLARVGGWSFDPAEGRARWSDPVCDILGVPRGTRPTLEEMARLHPPPEAQRLADLSRRLLEEGVPWEVDLPLAPRYPDPEGNRRWIRVSAEAMRDPEGEIRGMQGALQEITREKVLEAEREHLSDRIIQTLEGMGDAFFSFDSKGRFNYLNRAALSILGVEAHQVLGRSFLEAFPDAQGSELHHRMGSVAAGGHPDAFETWAARFRRWFRVQLYPSPDGLSVFFTDTTEIHRVMEALEDREARFRLVAEVSADAIWDWDLAGDTVWWSEGVRTLFGHDPEELARGPEGWGERVHPEDRPGLLEAMNQVLQGTEEGYTLEYRFRRADGRWAVVVDRARVVRDADGVPVRMVGGMTDLTEIRELELQFLRVQRMEGIGTLAGGIAHDLNNVLAPIVMSLDLLEESLPEPDDRELLETVRSSARRGAQLVSQLLTFARGAEGERKVVDPLEVLQEVSRIIRDTFPKDLVLSLEAQEGVSPILGDATQLHQAVLNLCVNARDAMPRGGRLDLRVHNVEVDPHFAERRPEVRPGPFVCISVRDTGEGMDAETRARIFDPFFTTKPTGKGTGLGLSTVLAIVRSHGGFVNVYSEAGRGSRFRLYLPASTGTPEASGAGARRSRRKAGQGRRILVVDDEPALVSVLSQALRHAGYQVVTAADGHEGVAQFQQFSGGIDAVVTDSMMPGMDGATMIRELLRVAPGLPVLATSGLHPSGGMDRLVAETGVRFLQKPYTAEQLLDELALLLGDAREELLDGS
jgi:two-component system cell cycle sensor histidine kinase/response regulator CckA